MSQSRYMLFSGAAALASLAAISVLAKAEGRPVLGPVNPSSHWLWGDEAGRHGGADLAHSGVGGATNVSAGAMWGRSSVRIFTAASHSPPGSPATASCWTRWWRSEFRSGCSAPSECWRRACG